MPNGLGHFARSGWAGLLIATLLFSVAGITRPRLAHAFIPPVERTMKAVAKVNRASGRTQALQFDLTMRVGERPPVAEGQLITHPSGLARLELRGFNGRVDRYLLSGRELLGAKNGERINRPQPLLQPLFFLQPSSEATLRAALESFDVLSDSIGLAPCGEQDCFVIGDPRLAAPLPQLLSASELEGSEVIEDPLARESEGASPADSEAESEASMRDLGTLLEGPELVIGEDALLPRLWVDVDELQVRRIDRANGVFTIFGPIVSFDKLMVPSWFEIHEPGAEPVRFDVDRAVQVNAPPKAFSRKWLLAPLASSDEGESPPGAAAGAGAP